MVMWYGARQVMAGQITTGDVIVFFAYVTNLYSPMKALARLSNTVNRATIGAERDPHIGTLNIMPAFEPVRADPRFAGLVRRMGLEPRVQS